MADVLLLGAGFTHNWGGWLAKEVFGDLAGRVATDAELSRLLSQADNFEDALAEVQNAYGRSGSERDRARLDTLQTAIAATFADMNHGLAARQFEFTNDLASQVASFLMRFDAIFSVNLDLLLELRYLNANSMLGRRWEGWQMPGIEPIPNPAAAYPVDPLTTRRRVAEPPFRLEARLQPYFKLHGSTDWVDGTGSPLLIVGGNKIGNIRKHPILTWYGEQFAQYLSRPNTRLMVIGYGFRDGHINDLICRGWQQSQLQMFIVDPDGKGILRKVNPTNGKLYCPQPIEEITIIGDSMRPLDRTFGPNDPTEHAKLIRFFQH